MRSRNKMKLLQLFAFILMSGSFLWFGKSFVDHLLPDTPEIIYRDHPKPIRFNDKEWNAPITTFSNIFKTAEEDNSFEFKEFLKGIPPNDQRLLKEIKKNYLIPPSKLPYNLSNPDSASTDHGQVPIIKEILGDLESGFFIESGAFDGEWTSNTLYLERKYGWTGLLIEPQPLVIDTLISKHRKAWISPVCLSPNAYPSQLDFLFSKMKGVSGKIGSIDEIKPEERGRWEVKPLQCLPLYSILLAMNIQTIDYWSLDVEGVEMSVLYNFPFDKIFVKTISIEHQFIAEKESIKSFMHSKGFDFYKAVERDFIFAHKSLNVLKTKLYGSFRNEFSGKCINSLSQPLEFNMGLYECHPLPVHQQTFTLTAGNVMRYFEGGCWSMDSGTIHVVRCFDEQLDLMDKWDYDQTSKHLTYVKDGSCLTDDNGWIKLLNCTEKRSAQRWIYTPADR